MSSVIIWRVKELLIVVLGRSITVEILGKTLASSGSNVDVLVVPIRTINYVKSLITVVYTYVLRVLTVVFANQKSAPGHWLMVHISVGITTTITQQTH